MEEVAGYLGRSVNHAMASEQPTEIDGLVLSFQSVSSLQSGVKVGRRKVRRNYNLKLITGGTEHYNCLVELDIKVSDGDVIEASSDSALFEFVRELVAEALPAALKGFSPDDLALFSKVILCTKPPKIERQIST